MWSDSNFLTQTRELGAPGHARTKRGAILQTHMHLCSFFLASLKRLHIKVKAINTKCSASELEFDKDIMWYVFETFIRFLF